MHLKRPFIYSFVNREKKYQAAGVGTISNLLDHVTTLVKYIYIRTYYTSIAVRGAGAGWGEEGGMNAQYWPLVNRQKTI